MIKVDNLTKWFGKNLAVDGVSFEVAKGEVLGFLGPNGAGKSTTMRMITGFIPYDIGTVTIGSYNIDDNPLKAKAMMGYLPENAPAYGDMTVAAFLGFIAALRGLSGRDRRIAVDKVIETCFLRPVRHQSVDTLSKGYLHRTCFAQSIIHDPDVLILDEPTDGLDPNQKHEVRNLIKRMGERKAIIISTHILEEVDAVCSRVIIINNGRLVANGNPAELKAQSKLAGSVVVTIHGVAYNDAARRLEQCDGAKSVQNIAEENGACKVRVYPESSSVANGLAERVHAAASESNWIISELHREDGRLDEVFRTITTSDTDTAQR